MFTHRKPDASITNIRFMEEQCPIRTETLNNILDTSKLIVSVYLYYIVSIKT